MHKTNRLHSLDLLRSLALLSMIGYHLCYDLEFFYGYEPLSTLGFLGDAWARATAGLFLVIVGVSFSLSFDRVRGTRKRDIAMKYLRRGLGVFACGMLVSAVTYMIEPATFVRFGILHLIGVSIVLLPLFAPLRRWNVIIALAITLLLFVETRESRVFTFFSGPSIDYFPLIPWFGVVLMGYGLAPWILHLLQQLEPLIAKSSQLKTLYSLGRYSLWIYLLHQPFLMLILLLLLGKPKM